MKSSSLLDRSYILLVYILVFSAVLTCIASPGLNVLLNRVLDDNFGLSRVMSRTFMAFTVLLLLFYRKRLKSEVGQSLNHTNIPWVRQLVWGFGIGIASLLLMTVVFCLLGATRVAVEFSLARLAGKLLKYLGVGLAVAAGEEIFFRGIVLQSLRADIKAFLALLFTSAFFSAVHFLGPEKSISMSGFDFLAGFKAAPRFVEQFGSFESIMWIGLGLFLVGAALATAYLATGSLFLPIGIHAGWIFYNKIDGYFFTEIKRRGLLVGETDISYLAGTDSLIAWLMMAVLIGLLTAFGSKLSSRKS